MRLTMCNDICVIRRNNEVRTFDLPRHIGCAAQHADTFDFGERLPRKTGRGHARWNNDERFRHSPSPKVFSDRSVPIDCNRLLQKPS